jgi:hypothetical protein
MSAKSSGVERLKRLFPCVNLNIVGNTDSQTYLPFFYFLDHSQAHKKAFFIRSKFSV